MNKRGLAKFLGLKPLDRVQLNDRFQIDEMNIGRRMGFDHSLPYLYFQRVLGDCLELCSPGGFVTRALPADVCNLIAGDPVVVRAMPRDRHLERISMSLAERQKPAPDHWYEPAYVLAVRKDRWGRVDDVWVDFLDERHNTGLRQAAAIADDSRRVLSEIARRDRMPIVSNGRSDASYSADRGVLRSEAFDAQVVRRFVRSAIKGHEAGVRMLADAGCKTLSTGLMNKRGIPL